MTAPNSGEVTMLGKPISDVPVKADLGVMFDRPYYQEDRTVKDIEKTRYLPTAHVGIAIFCRAILTGLRFPRKQNSRIFRVG
jgi:ABC-2 type transport system ATP-binding protein